ncbi:ribosome silencing factor [Auritidibacter sp. NML120636]|uniref:ribosome silencing factor n=1 Tax=Auritidibacter sp. NML120636 TaxID=2170743 RepID=UPI000D728B3F|nr:ribosome silencing factor [Auritidibacter sp. NML120636]PXA78675.1 ribosome silencing factor [Auritidibacter sp. NML120779]PXA80298.1 ribosome silencing factor [Auritidibacter sp. NML120636]
MSVPETTLTALNVAAQAADSKQGEHISAVDVAARLGITDAFLFVSASSERQVKALTEEIEDALRQQEDLKPIRREGTEEARWILLDYGHFVVHIQHREERELFALDRLWAEAPQIELDVARPEHDSELD